MRARRLRALRGLPVLGLTDAATRVAKDLVRKGALPEKATVDVELQALGERDYGGLASLS